MSYQFNINAKGFSEISIPLLPVDIQDIFAMRISEISKWKALMQQAAYFGDAVAASLAA